MPSARRSLPVACRRVSGCRRSATSPIGSRSASARSGGPTISSPSAASPAARSAAAPSSSAAASRCGWPATRRKRSAGLIDLTSNFPAPVPAQAMLGDLLADRGIGGRGAGRSPALPQCRRRAAAPERGVRLAAPSGPRGRAGTDAADQRCRGGARRRHAGARPPWRRDSGRAALLQRPAQPRRPARPASRAGADGRVRRRSRDPRGRGPPARGQAAGAQPDPAQPDRHPDPPLPGAKPSSRSRASTICCWSRTRSTGRSYQTARRPSRHSHRSGPSTSPACRSSLHRGCGWASPAAPLELVQALTAAQRDLSLGHAPLAGELFARALKAGAVHEALRQQRLEAGERQRLAATLLAGLDLHAQATALHVWLRLPPRWSSGEASLALARSGRSGGTGRPVLHRPRRRAPGDPHLAVRARHPRAPSQCARAGGGGARPRVPPGGKPAAWSSHSPAPQGSRTG